MVLPQIEPPRFEQTSSNPVTQQDLQQLADCLSDNLERSLRTLILDFQNKGDGTSNMPPIPPIPLLVLGHTRAGRLDPPPQVIILDPPNSPPVPQRSARTAPGKGDARHVINERYLRNGRRDAREVLNEKPTRSRGGETPQSLTGNGGNLDSKKRRQSKDLVALSPVKNPGSKWATWVSSLLSAKASCELPTRKKLKSP